MHKFRVKLQISRITCEVKISDSSRCAREPREQSHEHGAESLLLSWSTDTKLLCE